MGNSQLEIKKPELRSPKISDGDTILVNLTVKCKVRHSDKIISDKDNETGEIEYKNGLVLDILPNQRFVYDDKMETVFISSSYKTK